MKTKVKLVKIISFILILSLIFQQSGFAQVLPLPNQLINLSPEFQAASLKGLRFYYEDPFKFDFILEQGSLKNLSLEKLKEQSNNLIQHFLAFLTIPEQDLWVNLSPQEAGRIIPDGLSLTETGSCLLAQDYILKQLTSSLTYPESEIGKKFWDRVYEKAKELFGTTKIPLNTYSRVWIIPDKAEVFEDDTRAIIGKTHLKVMLEDDYLALKNNSEKQKQQAQVSTFSAQIMREVVIPEIEKEINEGKNFYPLRQLYHSLILAVWFKKKLREGVNQNPPFIPPLKKGGEGGFNILTQFYIDQNKTKGIDTADPRAKEQIYQCYLQAYKEGVYNFIRKDVDLVTNKDVKRRYFSGGFDGAVSSAVVAQGCQPKANMPQKDIEALNDDYVVSSSLLSYKEQNTPSLTEEINGLASSSLEDASIRVLNKEEVEELIKKGLTKGEYWVEQKLYDAGYDEVDKVFWSDLTSALKKGEILALDVRDKESNEWGKKLVWAKGLTEEEKKIVFVKKEDKPRQNRPKIAQKAPLLLPTEELTKRIIEAKELNRSQGWEEGKKGIEKILKVKVAGKYVFIGDIHGNAEGLRQILRDAGLIDANDNWIGGNTALVQMGDMIDRGPQSLAALGLLKKLQDEGAKIIRLLGNHELAFIRGMLGDDDHLNNWLGLGGTKVLEELGWQDLSLLSLEIEATGDFSKIRENEQLKQLLEEYIRDINDGKLTACFAQGGMLFVHGGVLPHISKGRLLSIIENDLNERLKEAINSNNFSDEIFKSGDARKEEEKKYGELAGIFWIDYDEELIPNENNIDIEQGVAHTNERIQGAKVRESPQGKVINLDVGISKIYGDNRGYLVIEGNQAQAYDLARRAPSAIGKENTSSSSMKGGMRFLKQSEIDELLKENEGQKINVYDYMVFNESSAMIWNKMSHEALIAALKKGEISAVGVYNEKTNIWSKQFYITKFLPAGISNSQDIIEEPLSKFIQGAEVTLRKIKLLEGQKSSITTGEIREGLILAQDIKVGKQIIFKNGNTSEVKSVELIDGNTIYAYTQTSVYEIKIVETKGNEEGVRAREQAPAKDMAQKINSGELVKIRYIKPITIKLASAITGPAEIELHIYKFEDLPSNIKNRFNKGKFDSEVRYLIIDSDEINFLGTEGYMRGFKGLRNNEVVIIGSNNKRFNFPAGTSPEHIEIKLEGEDIIIKDLNSGKITEVEYAASSAVMLGYFKQKLFKLGLGIKGLEGVNSYSIVNDQIGQALWYVFEMPENRYLELFIVDNDIAAYGITTWLSQNTVLRFHSFQKGVGQANYWARIYQERIKKLEEMLKRRNQNMGIVVIPTDQVISEAQLEKRIRAYIQKAPAAMNEVVVKEIVRHIIGKIRSGLNLSEEELKMAEFNSFPEYHSFGPAADFYVNKLSFDFAPMAISTRKQNFKSGEMDLLNKLKREEELNERQIIELFAGRGLVRKASSAMSKLPAVSNKVLNYNSPAEFLAKIKDFAKIKEEIFNNERFLMMRKVKP